MLDISAREVTVVKRTANGVRVKKWVGAVSLKLKPGTRKILLEAANAVSSVLGSSTDFSDTVCDVSIIEDKIVTMLRIGIFET